MRAGFAATILQDMDFHRADRPLSTYLTPPRVVIVGGGVAGLETLLALHALAEDRVSLTLISDREDFFYVPLAVNEPFGAGAAARLPLKPTASELGAAFVRGSVTAVETMAKRITLDSGEDLGYDLLVMCPGAHARPAYARAVTFNPTEDMLALTGLLQDVEERCSERVAFVVPPGVTWPLPLYELALMTDREVRSRGNTAARFTIVTPEDSALAILGSAASTEVSDLLRERGIEFLGNSYADQQDDGSLLLSPGGRTIRFDRVVALPVLEGPATTGLSADSNGFLPVDEYGRLEGFEHIYAAGDGTTFPVKQGGLATQQADAAAEHIAARAGAYVTPAPFHPVLRGKLLTGERAVFAKRDLGGGAGEPVASKDILWWPPHKIYGRYLAPFLAQDFNFDRAGFRAIHGASIRSTPPRPPRAPDVEVPLSSEPARI
jgi:sulfide:quinone oxidoreductase